MKRKYEDKEVQGIFIPKSTIWTLIVTIIISVITIFTRLEVGFKLLEKEIEIINLRLGKVESSILTNVEYFEKIKNQLHNIETEVTLKQDKKFVE